MSAIYAIIPAAGSGVRFGGKKQEALLKGISLLDRTVSVFQKTGLFKKIIVVGPFLPPPLRGGGEGEGEIIVVAGGKTRAESVFNGFQALKAGDDDIVLIHDAARPLVSPGLIKKVIGAAKEKGAVIPVLPLSDTVKKVKGDRIEATLDRSGLAGAQTPQGFLVKKLKKAYAKVALSEIVTDEARLLELAGEEVFTVEGEQNNIKITTPEDLRLAEFLCE